MIGPQLQRSIYSALKTANVADGRIYDRVPEKVAFPYITIGDENASNAGTTCGEAWTVSADIHAWSRPDTGSKGEVKYLAASIVAALQKELLIEGFEVVLSELESVRTLRDPDGMTEHSIVTIRYEVQPDP